MVEYNINLHILLDKKEPSTKFTRKCDTFYNSNKI